MIESVWQGAREGFVDVGARFEEVYARYRGLYEHPETCTPMLIIDTPVEGLPSWEARLADPMVMLTAELAQLRPHLELQDDRTPTVRVEFGTPQVAAAFGCKIVIPENSRPAAGSHVLARAEDVYELPLPALDAGWFGKLAEWTECWRQTLPPGIQIQHPDIQSAFNTAHLIRGNDILTDFYDAPETVAALLDKVTEYMIMLTHHVKAAIGEGSDWFFDWGALWKGCARISNCSMQMISPQLYREYVLPRDVRFFESVGGGRMHYCGITGDVMDEFFKVPSITGLDVDCTRHDFYELCRRAPGQVTLMPTGPFDPGSPEVKRMLRGDWPEKRNLILRVSAPSLDEGRRLLDQLRQSMPF